MSKYSDEDVGCGCLVIICLLSILAFVFFMGGHFHQKDVRETRENIINATSDEFFLKFSSFKEEEINVFILLLHEKGYQISGFTKEVIIFKRKVINES